MADLVITPEVTRFKVLGFGDAEAIIARGDEKARAHADELRAYALAADALSPGAVSVHEQRHIGPQL